MMENIRIILVKIQKIRKGRFVDAEPLFSPNGVALPVLRNVPVALFGDNKDHIDWNIKEGDIMPYFVLTFDISSYISQGSHDVMDSNRRNNLNNGFILPFTIPNATESLEFPSDIRIIGDRLEEGNIDLKGNVNIGEMYLENGELKNISAEGNVIVRKLYVKNRKQIEKLKKYLDSNKLFTVREFGTDRKNYENVVINPDKTMDIPREYFMSNFENEIIGYSVNSEIYDKLVKKYGRIDVMPENIKEIVPGYSKGIFRLDVDSDTDSFSKEDFVNGTGNYIKNAQEMVKTLNKKYYFIRQD